MKTIVKHPARRRLQRRRILIVNDLRLWHEAIANRLAQTPDLRVCVNAINEGDAFEKVSRLRPSLVLTEIFRPQDLGFIQELHRRHPRLPILVFSFRDEEAYALRVLDAGARGYLMKNVDGGTLVAGIRRALQGRLVLSPAVAASLSRCGHSS